MSITALETYLEPLKKIFAEDGVNEISINIEISKMDKYCQELYYDIGGFEFYKRCSKIAKTNTNFEKIYGSETGEIVLTATDGLYYSDGTVENIDGNDTIMFTTVSGSLPGDISDFEII